MDFWGFSPWAAIWAFLACLIDVWSAARVEEKAGAAFQEILYLLRCRVTYHRLAYLPKQAHFGGCSLWGVSKQRSVWRERRLVIQNGHWGLWFSRQHPHWKCFLFPIDIKMDICKAGVGVQPGESPICILYYRICNPKLSNLSRSHMLQNMQMTYDPRNKKQDDT